MKIGSLFTGYGGLDMAVEEHFDASTVWCSDIDPGACKIIAHRMPGIPNLGDITRVDWAAVEPVDILCGGWPCQPFSLAGKRKGAADERALWPFVAGAVRALRPRHVVLENVAAIATAGELARAVGDLSSMGYDAEWGCLRAAEVGAPHGRARIFIVAEDATGGHGWGQVGGVRLRDQQGSSRGPDNGAAADTERSGWDGRPRQLRQGWRAEPENGSHAPADPERLSQPGRRGLRDVGGAPSGSAGEGLQRQRNRDAADDRSAVAPDAGGGGREGGRGPQGRESDPGWNVRARAASETSWGQYEPAIRRWERILGREAPAPTETSPKGSQRLSPRFVEWMMGLPAGWVCDVPGLTRNEQLKALGNGVVPQQALEALRIMASLERAA